MVSLELTRLRHLVRQTDGVTLLLTTDSSIQLTRVRDCIGSERNRVLEAPLSIEGFLCGVGTFEALLIALSVVVNLQYVALIGTTYIIDVVLAFYDCTVQEDERALVDTLERSSCSCAAQGCRYEARSLRSINPVQVCCAVESTIGDAGDRRRQRHAVDDSSVQCFDTCHVEGQGIDGLHRCRHDDVCAVSSAGVTLDIHIVCLVNKTILNLGIRHVCHCNRYDVIIS